MSDLIFDASTIMPAMNPDGTPNEALKAVWEDRYKTAEPDEIKPVTEEMRRKLYDKPECWES